MGAYDQFKEQAGKVADGAKEQLGKRGRPADADHPEHMQRGGMRRDGQERGSDFEDHTRERMDRDSESEQDDWA